jgi:hypothetical protein
MANRELRGSFIGRGTV